MKKEHHLSEERARAVEHLVAASALCESDYFLSCYNPAAHAIDIDSLGDWRWSSGEQILIDILLTICGYPRSVQITDLWGLDASSRQAVITSLDIAMNGAKLATVLVHPSLQAVKK